MGGVSQRFSSRTSWDLGESGYAAAVREARASGRRLYRADGDAGGRVGGEKGTASGLHPTHDGEAVMNGAPGRLGWLG